MTQSCYDEKTLSAWVHEELPAKKGKRIRAHMADCQDCHSLSEQLRRFESAMTQALCCPSAEDIALWLEGSLPLPRARRLQNHIAKCDECAEMTEIVDLALEDWEEQQSRQQSKQRSKAKRTRAVRALRGRSRSAVPSWLMIGLPIAAAAALLLLLTLNNQSKPKTGPIAKTPTPIKTPKTPDPKTPDPVVTPKNPDPKVTPKNPDPVVNPDPKVTPDPKRPDPDPITPDPKVTPDPKLPDPTPKKDTSKQPRLEDMSLASAGGIAVQRPGKDWEAAQGSITLASTDLVMAQKEHGFFTFSDVQVYLRKGSVVQLEKNDKEESRLRLDKGEALFNIPKGRTGPRFVAKAGGTSTTALGTRFLVRKGKDTVVYVERGAVAFETPVGKQTVKAGQAFKGNERIAPKKTRKPRADSLAFVSIINEGRLQRGGSKYPSGFFALQAAEKVRPLLQAKGPQRSQALSLLRGLLLRKDLLPTIGLSLSEAELAKVQEEVLKGSDEDLVAEGSAPDLLRALLLQAWKECRGKKSALKNYERQNAKLAKRLRSLGATLAKSLKSEEVTLAQACEGLLALELCRMIGGLEKFDTEFWKTLAKRTINTNNAVSTKEHILLLLMPRRLTKSGALAQRLRSAREGFEARFADNAERLLDLQRISVLEGFDTRQPSLQRLLARTLIDEVVQDPSDRLAMICETLKLLSIGFGKKDKVAPAPVVFFDGEEAIVLFHFKPKIAVKTVYLCGSWDDWNEDKTSMVKQKDGSFTMRLRLPRGRHEYKFRLGDADKTWTTDPFHGLHTDNGHGGLNSVLDIR